MTADHCRPLGESPVTARIQAAQNNCYGAVLSTLYGFWAIQHVTRRDAYSIILEGTAPEARLMSYKVHQGAEARFCLKDCPRQ